MNGLVLVLAVILNPHAKREAEHEEHRSCEDTRENPHDSERHACCCGPRENERKSYATDVPSIGFELSSLSLSESPQVACK